MNEIFKEKFRKALSDMFDAGYKVGVAAENEACAKVCEEWGVYEAMECAAAIRERMK